MMKKDFYFIWKALFILKILVLSLWSCSKSNFVKEIKEIKFVSKFMTPKNWLTKNYNTYIGQYITK